MANNRMYLACAECAETFFLGKYYPPNWELASWTEDFIVKFNQFMFQHSHAHGEDMQWGERQGKSPFVLVTESQVGDERSRTKRAVVEAMKEAMKETKGG